MIALDTNALIRLVIEHPTEQAEAVHALLMRSEVFIPLTVTLEAEWALRSRYAFAKAEVLDALDEVAALPQVTVEHAPRVTAALAWARGGMDFADALHLAASEGCEALATFDRKLAQRADQLNAGKVELL